MRIQLLADHAFNVAGAGAIALREGSVVGDQPADYPLGQILNFTVTGFMSGMDAAGVAAVSAAGGPKYLRRPPQSDGSPLPPSWSGPRPAYQGGSGKNWSAA